MHRCVHDACPNGRAACCLSRFPVVLCPLAGENGGSEGSRDGGGATQAPALVQVGGCLFS